MRRRTSPSRSPWLAVGGAVLLTAAPAAAQGPPLILAAPERAQIVETLRAGGEAVAAGATDEALVSQLIRYGRVELGQRLRPSEVDRFWALEPPRRDPAAEFAAARQSGRLAEWLKALAPPYPAYRALQAQGRRYRALAAAGGWSALPAGAVAKPGDRGPQVAALRQRLIAEGYALPPAPEPDLFDPDLRKALGEFERRHGLEPDGKLSALARAALNVSAEDRAEQIEANLERWRWLPRPLPADRIEVDIAGAEATLYRAGAPSLTMRVVVGDPKHRTPMFGSALEAIVFNPPWNVPQSIAEAEILPKAAKDPGYLARNDYAWVDGHLQQRPGPKSALGLLKFDLASPFGVYLHDTPSRAAFQRRDRALSHGCMRLELPQALAERLLAPQGWTPEAIDRAIEAKATVRTPLKIKTPLFVTYWTAVADAAGQVSFRPDVYGWDRKLTDALEDVKMATLGAADAGGPCVTP